MQIDSFFNSLFANEKFNEIFLNFIHGNEIVGKRKPTYQSLENETLHIRAIRVTFAKKLDWDIQNIRVQSFF